ncbi:MAG: hypothetical protein ACN6O3_17120 [Comamonas sp.]
MIRTSLPSLSTPFPPSAASAIQERITALQIAPGQGLWCYLETGSTLHCTAGQVRISSPWTCALRLAEGDAPHCNGAHAGWYWLEADGAETAQLQLAERRGAGWRSAWQAVARWLGWLD